MLGRPWRSVGCMLIEEEYPPDKGLGGLREETDGLDPADSDVPVDEEVFNEPGYERLDYDRDGAVAC